MSNQLNWNYSSQVSFYAGAMSSKIVVTEAQEMTKLVHQASIKSIEDGGFVLQSNRPCIDISSFMETIKKGNLLMLVFQLDSTGIAEPHIYDSSSTTPCPCRAGARPPSNLRLPIAEEGEKILLFRDVSLTHFVSRIVAISGSEEAKCYDVVIDFTELIYPRLIPLHNLPTTVTFLPQLANNHFGQRPRPFFGERNRCRRRKPRIHVRARLRKSELAIYRRRRMAIAAGEKHSQSIQLLPVHPSSLRGPSQNRSQRYRTFFERHLALHGSVWTA